MPRRVANPNRLEANDLRKSSITGEPRLDRVLHDVIGKMHDP